MSDEVIGHGVIFLFFLWHMAFRYAWHRGVGSLKACVHHWRLTTTTLLLNNSKGGGLSLELQAFENSLPRTQKCRAPAEFIFRDLKKNH